MTEFEWILLGSGICWTLAYLCIIRVGARDRTYGMPVAALCANLSWEFIFSFIYPPAPPQLYVNYVWLGLDLAIAAQVLRYGPREWNVPTWLFLCAFLVAQVTAFNGVLLITQEFVEFDRWSGAYAAFSQNLMMSILFIEFLRNRPDARAQSMWIAVLKMLGTALASLAFYRHTQLGQSPLMQWLFLSILGFDLLYVLLLGHRLGLWQRRRRFGRAERRTTPQAEVRVVTR